MDRQEIIRKYLKLGFQVIVGPPKQKKLFEDIFNPRMPYNHDTIGEITNENIGICMGADLTAKGDDHPRYAHALDFDNAAMYTCWKDNNPDLASRCPTQLTSRGYHVLFTLPTIEPGGKSNDLTFIGHSWYILVSPSVHPNGSLYRWLKSPFETPLPHIETLEALGLGDRLHDLDWDGEEYPPSEDYEDAWTPVDLDDPEALYLNGWEDLDEEDETEEETA